MFPTDATAMFKIFREEFLDIVMQYNFTKNEFQTIVDDTIGSSGLESVLRLMKMSDNPKEKADDLLNKRTEVEVKDDVPTYYHKSKRYARGKKGRIGRRTKASRGRGKAYRSRTKATKRRSSARKRKSTRRRRR